MTDFMFCADFCTKKTHSSSRSEDRRLPAMVFVIVGDTTEADYEVNANGEWYSIS